MPAPDISIRPCRREEAAAVLDLWRHAQAFPSATDTLENLQRLCPLGIGFWDSLRRIGYENEPGVLRYVKTLTR
jgi:hypothetical protein